MTKRGIAKDFFTKTILPICIAGILFLVFYNVFTEDGVTNYFLVWIVCGIPFGIRRVRIWLIPRNFDIGGTAGVLAFNFIIGGLIGGFVLVWMLSCAAWYFLLTVYRILTYNSAYNRVAREAISSSDVVDVRYEDIE